MYSQIRQEIFQWLWEINWKRQIIDLYTDTIRTVITHTDTILMLFPMDIHTDTIRTVITHMDTILMLFPTGIITDTNTTTVDKLSPQQKQLSPTELLSLHICNSL
jgi:hypothetical protein